MIENKVKREDVPNASCYDCDTSLGSVESFATYKVDKQTYYKCGTCYEKQPEFKHRTEVYSRVVGYLRPVEQWNPAKQQEFKDRKTYKKVEGEG